jgi:hypothetical protein
MNAALTWFCRTAPAALEASQRHSCCQWVTYPSKSAPNPSFCLKKGMFWGNPSLLGLVGSQLFKISKMNLPCMTRFWPNLATIWAGQFVRQAGADFHLFRGGTGAHVFDVRELVKSGNQPSIAFIKNEGTGFFSNTLQFFREIEGFVHGTLNFWSHFVGQFSSAQMACNRFADAAHRRCVCLAVALRHQLIHFFDLNRAKVFGAVLLCRNPRWVCASRDVFFLACANGWQCWQRDGQAFNAAGFNQLGQAMEVNQASVVVGHCDVVFEIMRCAKNQSHLVKVFRTDRTQPNLNPTRKVPNLQHLVASL